MRTVLGLVACIAVSVASHAAEQRNSFELTLVDMQGQKKVLATLKDSVFAPRLSPDGRKVAFEQAEPPAPGEPQLTQIFIADLDKMDKRRALQQTVIARQNIAPVWSTDGVWIAFLATGNSGDSLFWEHADGNFQPKYLVDGRVAEGVYGGGSMQAGRLVYSTVKGDSDYGIYMLDIGSKQVTRLVDLPGSAQHSSAIAPNGKWLTYVSNETGRPEVWLEPMPQTGKRYQLTKNGGAHPEWSPDGSKIYFDQGGQVFRLDLSIAAEPRASEPVALPIKGFQQGDLQRQYDLTPDGKAFVMLFPVGAAAGAPAR